MQEAQRREQQAIARFQEVVAERDAKALQHQLEMASATSALEAQSFQGQGAESLCLLSSCASFVLSSLYWGLIGLVWG